MKEKVMKLFVCACALMVGMPLFGVMCSSGDDSSGDAGADTETGNDTDSETDSSTNYDYMGICGLSGSGVVGVDSYIGVEEIYLVDEMNSELDICRIRYDLMRLPEAPPEGCNECLWSHTLKISGVEVITDEDNGCSESDLGMSSADIEALEGQTVHYGYAEEYLGHADCLMKYDEEMVRWVVVDFANWDTSSGEFTYNAKTGFCGY